MSRPFRIERLAGHQREDFDCGNDALNDYLKRRATQDVRRSVAACYVAIEASSNLVAGYYTLSAGGVRLVDLPEATTRKLPRYPTVPVVRVGRLAVDNRFRNRGLGGALLHDAMVRAKSSDIGVFAIVVEAKHEQAANFYEHHGFVRLTTEPVRLFRVLK